MGLPIAVQLFSVREEMAQDFEGTLRKLKEMGYEGVELAGLYGRNGAEISELTKQIGLEIVCAHVPFDDYLQLPEATLDNYKQLGCSYLAVPYLEEERRYGGALYQETVDAIKRMEADCRKRDITLVYHNHDFEFEKTEQGNYVLDELLDAVPKMETELDTCWAKVAGVEPVPYLQKYAGRCSLVHIKDFCRTEACIKLVSLGEGVQDIGAIFQTVKTIGAKWIIIEQDMHEDGTPLGNMEKSLQYLHKM